ncbi:formate/nitrite transporter family protein [Luteolibacter marinus]|uniref:formate/nitrite transporter family protein n=1 Tax=Luteolibacter marinus TaxID=2776705 RepID=UPI001868DD09|nr:formate/nitrite transporter family protein [Luteolibacter marinus]
MPEIYGHDAYSPEQIAERIESVGVKKARLPAFKMFALAVLAGGFIGLGALNYTVVASDPFLGFAWQRLLGGLAFSLGLILVVVAGAELFTGNNLLVMSWMNGRITTALLLRNFIIVYFGNAAGAIGLAWLVSQSGHGDFNHGAVGETAVRIATTKTAMGFAGAFFKGILCNLLVCLAVWLAMAGRSVADKILAIVFPVSAFVAAGFEHSVANLYFVPLGLFLSAAAPPDGLTWADFLANNLLPVTLGNLIGGAGMVGLVYHLIYRLPPRR